MTHFPRTLTALAALALGLSVPAFAIPGVAGEEDSGNGEGTSDSPGDRGPGTDESPDYTSYIVNGRPAAEGEFLEVPYLSIRAPSGGGACTGSLIDPEWVLTAAHCIPDDATAIEVIFGETAQDSGCLLYTSDAADDLTRVVLTGSLLPNNKNHNTTKDHTILTHDNTHNSHPSTPTAHSQLH